jgi:hypothetical protein
MKKGRIKMSTLLPADFMGPPQQERPGLWSHPREVPLRMKYNTALFFNE